jgi:hypothetical protein
MIRIRYAGRENVLSAEATLSEVGVREGMVLGM